MSTTVDPEHETTRSEPGEQLRQLEEQEATLERRTRSLEMSNPLALLFSVLALGLAIGALAVALTDNSSTANRLGATRGGVSMPGAMGSSSSAPSGSSSAASGMMGGAGGHGRFSSADVAAAAHGTVYVQLGDYWVAPAVPTVRAGTVTFIANNVGRVPHELMVERMPMKFDAPDQPNEAAAQGMIADMSAGEHGRMTVRLSPGNYTLFCNAPGHYAAGQHITFKVGKS